jgi:hypothetical protein
MWGGGGEERAEDRDREHRGISENSLKNLPKKILVVWTGKGDRTWISFFFFFLVLGLELRIYTLSHSTSPFVCLYVC